MNVLRKATRAAIAWWIVLPLTLILTASIAMEAPELVPIMYKRVLVLAFVSVVAGTLVGVEDSNDVPGAIVGWIGAAVACSNSFSQGWFWEAGIFGMIGCYLALIIYFSLEENWDSLKTKFRRRMKKENKLVEEFRDRAAEKAEAKKGK